jgi:hypothetical protein
VALTPTHLGKFKDNPRPGVGQELEASGLLGLSFNPGSWGGVEVLPAIPLFIPHEAPGMGIALADNVLFSGSFMHGVTNGIPGRNAQLAQQ